MDFAHGNQSNPSTWSIDLEYRQPMDPASSLTNRPVYKSEPWLNDGNVVLETQQVQFCVHRSILSIHSTIFKDMFGLADSESDSRIDGLPVIYLADDEDDLRHVLKWMYDPELDHSPRLAHAYGLTILLQISRSALSTVRLSGDCIH